MTMQLFGTTGEITSAVPAGLIMFYANSTVPTGFLKCNGAAVSRTTYSSLFAAIGTTYGSGDGTTTFNVPDMRGYFPRGWVDDGTVDSGRAFGSSQNDALKTHTHTYVKATNSATNVATGSPNAANVTFSTDNTGDPSTGTSTETRPYNVAFLACIKY